MKYSKTKSALAVIAMVASVSSSAAFVSNGTPCQTWLPEITVSTTLVSMSCSQSNIDAALSGAGNVELGKFGSNPVTTLNGTFNGQSISISSLILEDWTVDGAALANSYLTGAFASVGQTLNSVQRAALLSLFLEPQNGAWKLVSDPNVSSVESVDGAVVVQLDGLYDASNYLNSLIGVVNSAIPGVENDLSPISFAQVSEAVKVTIDGQSHFQYYFTANKTGYATADGSYSGAYPAPEPSGLAILGIGLVGMLASRRWSI